MNNDPQERNGGELPVFSNDERLLRKLAGASFDPAAKLILPSGKELNADEAQAFTALYAPDEIGKDDQQLMPAYIDRTGLGGPDYNPLDPRWDSDWRSDNPKEAGELFAARAMTALYVSQRRRAVDPGDTVSRTGESGDTGIRRRRFGGFIGRLLRKR